MDIIFTLFFCHIMNENQAIIAYRPTAYEGGDIDKIRFGVLEDHYDHFWPFYIFLIIFIYLLFIFFLNLKIFRTDSSSVSTKINVI